MAAPVDSLDRAHACRHQRRRHADDSSGRPHLPAGDVRVSCRAGSSAERSRASDWRVSSTTRFNESLSLDRAPTARRSRSRRSAADPRGDRKVTVEAHGDRAEVDSGPTIYCPAHALRRALRPPRPGRLSRATRPSVARRAGASRRSPSGRHARPGRSSRSRVCAFSTRPRASSNRLLASPKLTRKRLTRPSEINARACANSARSSTTAS